MMWKIVVLGFAAVIGLAIIGLAGWIYSLPGESAATQPAPIAEEEVARTLAGLKPPKRARPLIAVVGINDATETTDYLMPLGILRRAGIADVKALAIAKGVVRLYPALTVEPDATIAEFDTTHPDGADYVIVPAMSRDDDPAVMAWLKAQSAKGAMVVGVCAGAKVVAAAGLLEGRRVTTHWYYLDELLSKHPAAVYVANRRFVVDRGVATTTGISASMPMSLTLIEAIAGRAKAGEVARDLGLAAWDARHDSAPFKLSRPFATTVMSNVLAFWRHERLSIALAPGIDEVTLALVTDAWSRTYRSQALTFAPEANPVATRSGVRIVPDRPVGTSPADPVLPPFGGRRPAEALDETLAAIARRYDGGTANAVAMQLEYVMR